ncbi:MAG: hypothetical protein ACJ735_03690 [Actinomycetes bacterium]
MAFVDAVLANSEARVVLVDRRHRPGGHWLDAYPFVQLHQPSANYGVPSRRLGDDRIDETGPNAGFYERAPANEICNYYSDVLDEDFVPSGRVQFLGMHDYRGVDNDGHQVVSLLTGKTTTIRARRLVDATYVESEIPSRHPPAYDVDPDVRVIPPNDLVNLDAAPNRFTVVGAGKTAMDTCVWLLDSGVNPDTIRWIRPRDPWMFTRSFQQPLELVASYMEMQARWVEATCVATDGPGFARRLEASGVLTRIDPAVEPTVFRGPIISEREIDQLRTIERVVRRGHVRRIAADRILFEDGDLDARRDEVYVDCTAAGVRPRPRTPVFAPDRITLQYLFVGIVPWSAATIGRVEASRDDDREKNRLCPPVKFSGYPADMLELAYGAMTGLFARGAEPDLAAWTEGCRLNPAMGAVARASEPAIADAFVRMASNIDAAMTNLAARVSAGGS